LRGYAVQRRLSERPTSYYSVRGADLRRVSRRLHIPGARPRHGLASSSRACGSGMVWLPPRCREATDSGCTKQDEGGMRVGAPVCRAMTTVFLCRVSLPRCLLRTLLLLIALHGIYDQGSCRGAASAQPGRSLGASTVHGLSSQGRSTMGGPARDGPSRDGPPETVHHGRSSLGRSSQGRSSQGRSSQRRSIQRRSTMDGPSRDGPPWTVQPGEVHHGRSNLGRSSQGRSERAVQPGTCLGLPGPPSG
jgi:hypothetical protein